MFSMEQTMTQLSALVAHHLQLVLLPAEQALLDEHLVDHGWHRRPRRDELLELLAVVGDAAAGAAEREGGADDRGQADSLEERHLGLGDRGDGLGLGRQVEARS
jgi:hypothetical protein